MNLKVLIEKGEDGYFVASVSSLKGRWSQGKALANIGEAIKFYFEPGEIETTGSEREIFD